MGVATKFYLARFLDPMSEGYVTRIVVPYIDRIERLDPQVRRGDRAGGECGDEWGGIRLFTLREAP